MRFFSTKMKKGIDIPDNKVKNITRGKTKLAVGTYTHKGKLYRVFRIIGRKK